MKLLFVISSLRGGGAEGVMCTLANELSIRGHKVTLVTTTNHHAYPLKEQVNLIESKSWRFNTVSGSVPSKLFKKIANRFLDFENLRKIIKREKPDLVMSFLTQWLTSLVIICKYRIPIIFADRNAAEYKLGRNDFFIRKVLFRLADIVQVMSYHDVAYLKNKYHKVVYMPNPLRFSPISVVDYEKIFDNRKHILAVGRLDPQKGFDKLIEAFSMIASNYPDWDVDICGEDMVRKRYSEVLKKKVKEKHLENRVHFIGFHKDIDKIMREHSIFCLSSIHEGFPNVLSEAMANGMACISFDIVTGPHEIIIDGLDGLIVEDQNVEAMSKGLEMLMRNRELRFSFGLHAIENIKRFNKNIIVDKWENLFLKTINKYHDYD